LVVSWFDQVVCGYAYRDGWACESWFVFFVRRFNRQINFPTGFT